MLLNNFKVLLDWYPDGVFTNVLNEQVHRYILLAGNNGSGVATYDSRYGTFVHNACGNSLAFDYKATDQLQYYIEEKTSYRWFNIVSGQTQPVYIADNTSKNVGGSANSKATGFTIFVGTGTTPVEPTDYCLDSAITLASTSGECHHNAYGKTVVKRTFVNDTSDSVDITEIGLYMFDHQGGNPDSGPNGDKPFAPVVMMGRKVFDTPVTIEVGDSYTFTYIIDFNQITFADADS